MIPFRLSGHLFTSNLDLRKTLLRQWTKRTEDWNIRDIQVLHKEVSTYKWCHDKRRHVCCTTDYGTDGQSLSDELLGTVDEMAGFEECCRASFGSNRAHTTYSWLARCLTLSSWWSAIRHWEIHLRSHLDFFSTNLGLISDGYGDRLHQSTDEIENYIMAGGILVILVDNCWTLITT